MTENENDKWWPQYGHQHVARSEEVVYAAVGPQLTNKLVRAHDECRNLGIEFDPDIEQFFDDLRRCDGRPPEMLFLMAAAAAVVAEADLPGAFGSAPAELIRNSSLMGDTFKLFGWLVIEALESFGIPPAELPAFLESQHKYYGDTGWPPRGAQFTQEVASDPVIRMVERTSESLNDPLAFWLGLQSRPSLIGAHLVSIEHLERYRDELRKGAENLERDLKLLDEHERPDAEQDLLDAVEMVAVAVRLISDAQGMIVRHFST